MKTIREIALEAAPSIWPNLPPHWFKDERQNEVARCTADFAESVLAAYLAQQDPVGHYDWNEAKFIFTTKWEYSKHHKAPLFLAPPIKPGFVLVPVEPTHEMLVAGCTRMFLDADPTTEPYYIYRAMIQASQEGE